MFEKKMLVIVLQLAILQFTEAFYSIQANWPSCSYKCDAPKKEDNKGSNKIKDFYWRDFYFVIPPDAFQLGDDNQNPQTYVGLVFDPSNNGSFVTTIVEGKDHVYGVRGGNVSKRTQQIQILCTMEPEKMSWMELYNVDQAKGAIAIKGGFHYQEKNDSEYLDYVHHYVVKTSEGNVVYAGYSTGLNTSMIYATKDGTPKKIEKFLWLLYEKEPRKQDQNNKPKPFFSYNYQTSFNAGSLIPKFHHQINIGSCSLVCTNQGTGDSSKAKMVDKRSENAMVYYWMPKEVNNTEDALQVGIGFSNEILYTAQVYTSMNWYDVGETEGNRVFVSSYGIADVQLENFHILSSISQEKLEWINSTTNSFGQLDKTKLVPGGQLDNGTETFVGRAFFVGSYKVGSIRVLPHGTYCFLLYGDFKDFQVLSIKDEKS